MANTRSNFKVVFIGVFVAAAVIGVLVFSGIIKVGGTTGSADVEGTATIWGTFDSRAFSPFIQDFNDRSPKVRVTYEQKNPETFEQELIEAIADGQAPDLVLIPDNLLYRFNSKLTHIPYASLPAQTLNTTFVDGAAIFRANDGSLAVPFAADPLVMYYNKDMLNSIGVVTVPRTWQEFVETVPELVKKDSNLTLSQSATALGTFKNIEHAKDIIALLFLQSGNPFITNSPTGIVPHFGSNAGKEDQVAQEILNFYLAFQNPNSEVYTWNNGQPNDIEAFLQGNLTYYFGSASELPSIRAQNPNLNIDIYLPPQSGTVPMTTGRFYGLAIPKAARNQLLSYTAATLLANTQSSTALTKTLGTSLSLMPVRRDVLAQKPTNDPYLGLLYNTVLVMKPWFDPNPALTSAIMSSLLNDITSGRLPTDQALTTAASQFIQQSQ